MFWMVWIETTFNLSSFFLSLYNDSITLLNPFPFLLLLSYTVDIHCWIKISILHFSLFWTIYCHLLQVHPLYSIDGSCTSFWWLWVALDLLCFWSNVHLISICAVPLLACSRMQTGHTNQTLSASNCCTFWFWKSA